MTPEQITTEIARKYGLPVREGAYKLCPPKTYTWQIDPEANEPITPREHIGAFHRNRARASRLANAIGPKRLKSLEEVDHTSRTCHRLRMEGRSTAEIAAYVGLSTPAVYARLRDMGLVGASAGQSEAAAGQVAHLAACGAEMQGCASTGENVGVL